MKNDSADAIKELLDNTSPDTKKILSEIIKIENSKIHQGSPQGLYVEILDAVKRTIA
jgi:hypothetical protein